MTVHPPPALLDPMVLATDDEEALASIWPALLEPEGDVAWERAVERRRRIDDLAGLIHGHAWLSALVLSAKRLSRRHGESERGPRLEAQVSEHALAATLGPEKPEPLELSWGKIVPRAMPVGTRVHLRVGISSEPVAFFFARAGESGPLPGAAWELLKGEGPVLLIACMDAAGTESLEEALEHTKTVAGVILREQ